MQLFRVDAGKREVDHMAHAVQGVRQFHNQSLRYAFEVLCNSVTGLMMMTFICSCNDCVHVPATDRLIGDKEKTRVQYQCASPHTNSGIF
jgi:hypothetical protein